MTNQEKWDARGLDAARLYASWSKDPSLGVGAYIANARRRPVSLGYNGLPAGVEDSPARLLDRATKLRVTLHAETNAILSAERPVQGCTLYVYPIPPCAHCAAQIIQAGIVRVVAGIANPAAVERWADDIALSRQLFQEAGIDYLEVRYD